MRRSRAARSSATGKCINQASAREITGVAYYVAGSDVVADANASYRVTLTDPSKTRHRWGRCAPTGTASFRCRSLSRRSRRWAITRSTRRDANGNDINGSFRVAEFKPPNFKIALTLDRKSATAGSSVRASVAAAYLFGAPLQGGTAHAYVTRDVASVQPKGWDDFSFGPQWYYPEQTPSFDTDVLQRDLPLDAQGRDRT